MALISLMAELNTILHRRVNMLQIAEVDIHPDALIACPEVEFKMRKAAKACPKCPNWAGVGLMNSDPAKPWNERFAIRCAHVIERRTHILEVFEELEG